MGSEDTEKLGTFDAVIRAIDETEVEEEKHLSVQIDKSVRDAIQAAQTSGQPAAVTVRLKIKPGPERRMGFAATVDAKLPRTPVAPVMLYADDKGQVHRSDPAQQKLPFQPVPITRNQRDN